MKIIITLVTFMILQRPSVASAGVTQVPKGMTLVPQGKYLPFTSSAKKSELPPILSAKVEVPAFFLDKDLVTNDDFLIFVKGHPEWRKSLVKKIFADSHYLDSWPSDTSFKKGMGKYPVTRVSWFAASAYCESLGKQLPTTDQWEIALRDNNRNQEAMQEKILVWYSKPSSQGPSAIRSTQKNGFGIWDLGNLVWEWTEDFNSFLSSLDSRDNEGKNASLFCGSGSQMGDPSDYATFMRYSFRSSLKPNYTTANLGFRCAKEAQP